MSGSLRDFLFHEEPGVVLYRGHALDVLRAMPEQSGVLAL